MKDIRQQILLILAINSAMVFCSEKGHFKGMRFRHVIKHYVIQAGDTDSVRAAEDLTLKGKHYSQLDTRLLAEIIFFLLHYFAILCIFQMPFDI